MSVGVDGAESLDHEATGAMEAINVAIESQLTVRRDVSELEQCGGLRRERSDGKQIGPRIPMAFFMEVHIHSLGRFHNQPAAQPAPVN